MPTGLIDIDILIDAQRGIADAISFLAAQHALGRIQISAISAMELIQGCRNMPELTNVEKSLANMVIHEISTVASRQARVWLTQFSLGHGLQLADALIAAAATSLSAPLYTKNNRHFQMLPGLTVTRPY